MTTGADAEPKAFVDAPGHPRSGRSPAVCETIRGSDGFDYAAWLREYRRWAHSGSCGSAWRGEIEWGGEGTG